MVSYESANHKVFLDFIFERCYRFLMTGKRLFENKFLERLTHVHPAVPVSFWVPISFLFLALSLESLSSKSVVLLWICGFFSWTLFEYSLHRFVFHSKINNPHVKHFVWLVHGIHHDDPNDKTRLLMPLVPSIILGIFVYSILNIFILDNYLKALFSGFIIGYMAYDYLHYLVHTMPLQNRLFKWLRSYHALHHHHNSDGGFGVSTPLWDYVFNTLVKNNRLKTRQ